MRGTGILMRGVLASCRALAPTVGVSSIGLARAESLIHQGDREAAPVAQLAGEAARDTRGLLLATVDIERIADHVHSAPARALTRYFRGDPTALDELPADPGGTGFQAAVWNALRHIPAGETRTYGQLAAEVGHPGSARAAGGAVGSNPIPLVIPCHRIVGADGRLTGFGGGVARKHWLLRHEGVALRDDTAQLALALAD